MMGLDGVGIGGDRIVVTGSGGNSRVPGSSSGKNYFPFGVLAGFGVGTGAGCGREGSWLGRS